MSVEKDTEKSRIAGVGSQSEYISVLIENDILNGRLPPNTPIKSIRELARLYQVSKTVVCCAMDILEQKKLVTRIPRKGFYAKGKSSGAGMTDVLFFAMDHEPAKSSFIRQMMKLVQSPRTGANFNFTLRLACSQSADCTERLEEELMRLEKFGYPDCAVIIPIEFRRREVEMCLKKLPFPVIFLGDFADGDYPGLNYRRIYPVSQIPEYVAQYAEKRSYRHVINVRAEISGGNAGEETARSRLKQAIEASGMDYSEIIIPGKSSPEAYRILPYVLEKERSRICSADLIYSDWVPLPELSFDYPDRLNGFPKPGTRTPWIRVDYDHLFDVVLTAIRCCKEPLHGPVVEGVPIPCVGIEPYPDSICLRPEFDS